MTEAVVLLPGFMADGRVFVDQVADLSRAHAVQVAPLIGDTLEAMAESVLAHAPPKFALAGHDLGGAVAIEIMQRAPERVTRLALICAAAQGEAPSAAAAREPRLVRAKAGRLKDVLEEDLPQTSLADSDYRDAIRGHWLEMAVQMGVDTYLQQSRVIQRRPDFQQVLRRARLPCMMIGGAANKIVPPRRQEFMAELMPNARFTCIQGAGHLPMIEAPRALTRALQTWLEMEELAPLRWV